MAASREHQGLIISLIIFVMLTVILSVMSVYLYNLDEDATARREAAEEAKKKADEQAALDWKNFDDMKKMYGFTDADTLKTIQDKYDADTKDYKVLYPEEEKLNYSDLIVRLAHEIRTKNDQVRTQAVAIGALRKEIDSTQKTNAKVIAERDVSLKLATDDLASRTLTFETSVRNHAVKLDRAASFFKQDQEKAAAAAKVASTQISKINDDFERADRRAKAANIKLNERDRVETEVADGRITSINQTSGKVYLNLGRADALRPQVTFSVHGQNVASVAGAKPKAKIIITRLLSDPHMAEARVVEEDIANPIIRGDKIFSPAWSPGRKIHFAFAGTVDMDGDGRSDMKRIRDLVAINNGVVDAWPDESGDMTGRITTNTRYLVVGEAKLKNDAAIEARSTAIDKARENGVEQLSVVEFLDMMGWKNSRRTVRLGRGAKTSDFKPRRPITKSTGNVNDFKPRRP